MNFFILTHLAELLMQIVLFFKLARFYFSDEFHENIGMLILILSVFQALSNVILVLITFLKLYNVQWINPYQKAKLDQGLWVSIARPDPVVLGKDTLY
jgi:hypothetical protein